MLLLDSLIQYFDEYKITDIHFLIDSAEAYILLRRHRVTVKKIQANRDELNKVQEYILYKSQFHHKLNNCFHHLSLEIQQTAIRASYYRSLSGQSYLTLRLHKTLTMDNHNQTQSILRQVKSRFFLIIIGPINSGKTTLYYQLLSQLYEQQKTILSAEHPVEKHLEFWQIKLDSHQGWLELYEQVIRFDLDIVAIGEIRKLSYLKILNKIYLSGHNIITTIHAQSLPQWSKQPEVQLLLEVLKDNKNLFFLTPELNNFSLYHWQGTHEQKFQPMALI